MTAIPLTWHCAMCDETGAFTLAADDGVRLALQLAKDEHGLESPRCHMENQGRHVRVSVDDDREEAVQ